MRVELLGFGAPPMDVAAVKQLPATEEARPLGGKGGLTKAVFVGEQTRRRKKGGRGGGEVIQKEERVD